MYNNEILELFDCSSQTQFTTFILECCFSALTLKKGLPVCFPQAGNQSLRRNLFHSLTKQRILNNVNDTNFAS